MFEGLAERFSRAFSTLRGKGRISPADVETTVSEIRSALLEADVALSVVDQFAGKVRDRSLAALEELRSSTNPSQEIFALINEELVSILGGAEIGRAHV